MQAFQRDLKDFEGLNAQVLGVSGDSVETHRRFAAENGLGFPLIADVKGEIARLYPGGRVTYIIDKTGTVRFVLEGVPDNKVLLGELRRIGK